MYQGLASYYDRWMTETDFEAWATYLCSLFENAGKPENLTIYDVACGTGNISIPLAKRGYRLIASDISEPMLEIAQQKARLAHVQIPFVKQDLRNLSLHRKADIINCSCDGVNYLLNTNSVNHFFASARDCLREGGLLCFDISSYYKLSKILADNTFAEDGEDAAYFWQNYYDEDRQELEMYLNFFVESEKGLYRRFKETHIQKAHQVDFLCELLQNNQFLIKGVYGDFSCDTPKENSERIFFLAQKTNH